MLAPDAIAVDALILYLRRYLPAKVTALNALREAVLTSALAGPFTVPAGAVLRLAAGSHEATPTDVALTSGSRTAAQVAADIEAVGVPGLTASADDYGRLVLTADDAPLEGAPSVVIVAQDVDGDGLPTGSNECFGWAEGGEHLETIALTAPSWRGVVDGLALTGPDMGQGFWVIIRNRSVRPTHPGIRRDTYLVTMTVDIWRPFSAHAPPHRSREAISSCVRAVRELVESDDGRYLGRQAFGDVQLTTVEAVSITGEPLVNVAVPGVLFDVANLTLNVRVFQRPD